MEKAQSRTRSLDINKLERKAQRKCRCDGRKCSITPGVWLKARVGARSAYRLDRKALKTDHVAINQIVVQHHLREKVCDLVINSYRMLNQSLSVSVYRAHRGRFLRRDRFTAAVEEHCINTAQSQFQPWISSWRINSSLIYFSI